MEKRLAERPVAERADVGARREHVVAPSEDDRAHLGVVVDPFERAPQLVHQLRRQRVPGVRAVELEQRYGPMALLVQHLRHESYGRNAEIPVASRPMISFWIWEVPSYRVVTRASRK